MSMKVTLCAAAAAAILLAARPAPAEDPKAKPKEITAEALVKECQADRDKALAKYKGKALRVAGKVHSVYDEVLYLDGGGADQVVIRFGTGAKPAVKPGDTATFDGTFDLIAVLGPALKDCKLVAGPKPKR
jgi:hypothetical protein